MRRDKINADPLRHAEALALAVDKWNAANPVGTAVEVTKDDGSVFVTKTRSDAWVMGGHSAMVMVEGISGGYLLGRVRPVPKDDIDYDKFAAEWQQAGQTPIALAVTQAEAVYISDALQTIEAHAMARNDAEVVMFARKTRLHVCKVANFGPETRKVLATTRKKLGLEG